MMQRVLVTGARGFVGRSIVKELLKQNAEVLALDRTKADFNDAKAICEQVDLLNKEELYKKIDLYRPTSVIHLAAIAAPVYGNVAELYNINIHGSENLLDVLADVCPRGTRVVLTSTAGVYGNASKEFIDEQTPYNPQNHYSFSKMVMEYIAKFYDSLDIKIIRPFNMIGAGQNENFLVPKLVQAYVKKQDVLSVGNMQTYRDFTDVGFAAQIFCKAALCKEMKEKVLNICSGKGTCGNDILNILEQITGYKPKIEVNPQFLRKNEIMRLVGDPAKCNGFIGNNIVSLSVREILEEMVRFYSD